MNFTQLKIVCYTMLFTIVFSSSCTKDDNVNPKVDVPIAKNEITDFRFKSSLNPSLGINDIVGSIKDNEIILDFLYGTDLTNLKPTIIHNGKSIDLINESTQDFSKPIIINVVATDGNKKTYAIKINILNIYAAGSEALGSNLEMATLWKNGIATNYTDGTKSAYATSVFVTEKDIYVVGNDVNENDTYSSKVWKNNSGVFISNNRSYATSVFVSNNKVYISGYEMLNGDTATLWENGVANNFVKNYNAFEKETFALDVCVSGVDTYTCGYEFNESPIKSTYIAKIWKNGIATNLSDGTTKTIAKSVYVSGNDVYVAGYEYTGIFDAEKIHAKLWKNGKLIDFFDETTYSRADDVYVVGSDVYVVGFESINLGFFKAKMWKNGIRVNLFEDNITSRATTIDGYGSNICIAILVDNRTTKIWKNGIITDLSTKQNSYNGVNSIYLSKL